MLPIPDIIVSTQKRVEKYYKKAIPRQVLQVIGSEGRVEIEVEVRGEVRSFQCSPVQYQVLQTCSSQRRICIDNDCGDW